MRKFEEIMKCKEFFWKSNQRKNMLLKCIRTFTISFVYCGTKDIRNVLADILWISGEYVQIFNWISEVNGEFSCLSSLFLYLIRFDSIIEWFKFICINHNQHIIKLIKKIHYETKFRSIFLGLYLMMIIMNKLNCTV